MPSAALSRDQFKSAFGWALAYFQVPRALVSEIEAMGLGLYGTGIMVAVAFLIIGMIIAAIPGDDHFGHVCPDIVIA